MCVHAQINFIWVCAHVRLAPLGDLIFPFLITIGIIN